MMMTYGSHHFLPVQMMSLVCFAFRIDRNKLHPVSFYPCLAQLDCVFSVFKMEDSDTEKFCLNWNDFQSNFISQFEALKEDEEFVDVTLYCQGKCIKAHKVVLSACSPYLKNIFKEHPGKHPIIILDNLSYNNLEAVVQFVYTGQVYVELSELSPFLKAAETLQIKGLFESTTNQTLMKGCKTDVQDSNVKFSRKREANLESDIKKVNHKRKAERVTSSEQKENSELKNGEKDCTFQSDNLQAASESILLNPVNSISEKGEFEERRLGDSNTVEGYTPDGKKAHWLDPRSCPLCNKVYSNLSNLRQHMKIMHNPTLVTCRLCYKTFKTDLYLRRHLVSFHALAGTGSDLISVESHKTDQIQPLIWNSSIKSEKFTFDEVFNHSELYQDQQ